MKLWPMSVRIGWSGTQEPGGVSRCSTSSSTRTLLTTPATAPDFERHKARTLAITPPKFFESSFSPLGLTWIRTFRRPVPFAGATAAPRAISTREGPSDRTSMTQERVLLVMISSPPWSPGGTGGTATGGPGPGPGGSTITGGGSTTTGGGVPHPVIEALSIGKPQISWFVNQP